MIFVIVILGILGTFSSEILLRMYQTYVMDKGVQNIEIQLKTTLEQIGNYTEKSIKPSVVLYRGDYKDISEISSSAEELKNDGSELFMWIGKDIESFQGIWNGSRIYPAYSGLVDLENSSGVTITSPDGDFRNIPLIVNPITDKTVTTVGERNALYFVYGNSSGTAQSRFWNNPTSLFPINSYDSGTQLTLDSPPPEIGDIYYLSYSGYGVKLDGQDLKLVWNFRPWESETFSDGVEVLLAEHITKFRVWSESGGGLIRFYICATDPDITTVSGNPNWEYCKESVVLR